VSAAAVSAVIDIVQEEGLLARAAENGQYFIERLRELSARHSIIANVRGQGLMIGFDLLASESLKNLDVVNAFMYGCRRRGVHLTYGYGGVNFRIIPPLVITRSEIDFAIKVIEESLKAATAGPAPDLWPRNPQTSRLFEKHPLRRLVNYLWRSSPADDVETVQERLGAWK
jgi:4-aminobutyrate aminotransferase-like enzyme